MMRKAINKCRKSESFFSITHQLFSQFNNLNTKAVAENCNKLFLQQFNWSKLEEKMSLKILKFTMHGKITLEDTLITLFDFIFFNDKSVSC